MAVSISLDVKLNSQNIESNTSNVTVECKATWTHGSFNATYQCDGSLTIDGTKYDFTKIIFNAGRQQTGSEVIMAKTLNISHDSQGEKTLSCSAIFNTRLDSSGTQTASTTKALTTIPRKSDLKVGNGILGKAQTLEVTRKHATFTHTITCKCGTMTRTICEKSKETSISWTPPVEFAEQNPSGSSLSLVYTITTYNGDTAIGSAAYSVGCTIPNNDTFVPVLVPATSDAMGYAPTYGALIQGHSKLKVDITTYGAYGAWITSVKATFDGKTYTDTAITTDVISGTGDLVLTITVTDSRGRTSTSNATFTVLPYEFPKITALTAARCNADGTLNPSGAYMLAKFSAILSTLGNKNTATYYVGYKKVTAENHTAVEMTSLKGQYSVTNGTYIFPADADSSYTVIFTAIDALSQARTTTNGPSVSKVISFLKKGGKIVGMALGKVAEHEGFLDIGWKVRFSGGGDTVIEQGEKDGWCYRKWDSGVAECWKIQEFSTTINTAFGSLYCGNAFARVNYPFAFIEKPVENVTLQSGSTQAILYCEASGYGVNGTNASARYNVFRPGAISTAQTFYLSFHVIGKWK